MLNRQSGTVAQALRPWRQAQAGLPELLSRIGNTPLVPIRRLFQSEAVQILAKLESLNPGGSVKDRAALRIIQEAELRGDLLPGKTILDATSGNTGIAYAMIGASKGYPVELTMPENASVERKKILRAYGARLVLTDPLAGSDGAIEKARELFERSPDQYFYADQYSNEDNWKAHYHTTAPEIYRQTNGRVTHFVAGLGTSGTMMGTARRLREFEPAIRCISVMPDSPIHGLEGLKHMPTAMVPSIYDPSLVDESLEVGTEEAQAMVVRLAREEGLFVGISSGAAMAGALEVAAQLQKGTIVAVFCDGGDKYLSEQFWEEY
ncbi:MAG TPA: cysteine synthase family protein [Acidobacteriota bacterium]|nr:cysteine synthase family protein [Acidobacteriota bacterium]